MAEPDLPNGAEPAAAAGTAPEPAVAAQGVPAAPEPTPPAPSNDLAEVLAGPDLPTEEVLERAEAKPPRYRLVRGAIYTTYMILVAWFCIAVTVAVWRAVWGADGHKLQAQDAQTGANLKHCKE